MTLYAKNASSEAKGVVTIEDGYGIIRVKVSKVWQDGTKSNINDDVKCEIPLPTG
jgi:hypothetical protein